MFIRPGKGAQGLAGKNRKLDTRMKKKKYISPRVLNTENVLLENNLLAGSVVNKNSAVQTKGQEVVSYDFQSSDFNQVWE